MEVSKKEDQGEKKPKFCYNHQMIPYSFYCFDDKTFLCNKCFKDHKRHMIEEKEDIENKEKAILLSAKFRKNFVELLKELKIQYKDLISEINSELKRIDNTLLSISNISKLNTSQRIFGLSYKEYQNASMVSDCIDELPKIRSKYEEIEKKFRVHKGYFQIIEKDIQLVESSEFQSSFPFISMVDGNDLTYSLFNGQTDNYIILDLKKNCFIKDFQMLCKHEKGIDCIPKNFSLSIKRENGEFEKINDYTYNKENSFLQIFDVYNYGKILRIDFKDCWGQNGGNYLLISRIGFVVADSE